MTMCVSSINLAFDSTILTPILFNILLLCNRIGGPMFGVLECGRSFVRATVGTNKPMAIELAFDGCPLSTHH